MSDRSNLLLRISAAINELRPDRTPEENSFETATALREEFPGLKPIYANQLSALGALLLELERDGLEALARWAVAPPKTKQIHKTRKFCLVVNCDAADKDALRSLAIQQGKIRAGKPNISDLIKAIALREIALVKPEAKPKKEEFKILCTAETKAAVEEIFKSLEAT